MRKNMKTLLILIFALALFIGMAACGNNPDSSEQQAEIAQAAAAEPVTVEQDLPVADPNGSVDGLIGSWKDINTAENFANITKTETGYQYEDNDGKYPATFEKGVLKVKASETDTADVYIDSKTGHMYMAFQGGLSEYEKK